MNRNYSEGTWFAVPLKPGGFATGIVAKAANRNPIILCYFFGPKRNSVPMLSEVESLKAAGALRVYKISDLALFQKAWPVIGRSEDWDRSEWPMPVFLRRDPLRHLAWRAYYSDTDPGLLVREEPAPYDINMEPDSTLGAKATEIVLAKLLIEGGRSPQETPPPTKANPTLPSLHRPIEGGLFRIEILQQLQSFGSDIRKQHRFNFYLYFSSKTAARDAAHRISEKQFETKIAQSSDGNNWLCEAAKSLVPESAPLDEINNFFQQIAASLHGEFDGWESDIVKP